jgi:hypothetical protein
MADVPEVIIPVEWCLIEGCPTDFDFTHVLQLTR